MPKFEPIELEFVLDKKVNQDAKNLEKSLGGIGEASKKNAEALKEAIEAQKLVIKSVEKDIDALEKKLKKSAPGRVQAELAQEAAAAKRALDEEKAALTGLEADLKKTATSTAGLTTKKRQLQEALAMMELQGLRGSESYEKMRTELALLTDAMHDAVDQGKILGDDYVALKGIISGASGIAGAFSTAAGVVGLFGKENEELNRIQTRVQSLMAITIGLQQTLNVLNKDSAFRLHTVVKAKELWAKAVALLNTRLKISVGLSKALMVGGIGLLLAGITALVLLYDKWKTKQDEINKLKNEFRDIQKETIKNVADEKIEINSILRVAQNYNASLEVRNKAIEKLKTIMPEYNGYIDREGTLVDNSNEALKRYLETLVKVERAKALMAKVQEKTAEREIIDSTGEGAAPSVWQSLGVAFKSRFGSIRAILGDQGKIMTEAGKGMAQVFAENRQELITDLDQEITKLQSELDKLLSDGSVFDNLFGTDGKSKNENSNKKEFNAEKELQNQLLNIRRQTAQLLFDQRQNNLQKRLDQVDREHEMELQKITDFQKQVIEKYNEANKDKKGFTPLSTEDSKLKSSVASIDPETAKQFEEETAKLTEAYAQKKVQIYADASEEIKKIMQGLGDSYLNEQEQEINAVRQKYDRLRQELINYQGSVTETQEQLLQDAQQKEETKINDEWFIKTNDAFITLFGNVDRETTKALQRALDAAKRIVEEKKNSLSATDLKSYVEAITRAENELRSRNPFKALVQAVKDYQTAADEAAKEDAGKRIIESASEGLNLVKGTVDSIASSLDELGFLSEDQKKMFSQVSGIFDGAGNIAEGIASKNPLQIIQGSIGLITNAIGLFDQKNKRINRDIEKTQKRLKDLSREFKELERATNQALGTDVYKNQIDEVKNLEKQIELNKRLIVLEQQKSNKKRDDNKIEGLRDEIQSITNEIEDTYQEIFERIVQTNVKSLADDLASKLIEGFKAGEDAAKSFEEVSSQVLQNAVKNALKMQLLEEPIQRALVGLKAKMGSEVNGVFQYDGLTEEEAEAFKGEIAAIGSAYADALKGLDFLFDEVDKPDSSLSGAIKGVSEDTASALAGQITAIRIYQAETQSLIRQQLFHMAEIAINTRQSYRILSEIRDVVKNNENDPLRSKGL